VIEAIASNLSVNRKDQPRMQMNVLPRRYYFLTSAAALLLVSVAEPIFADGIYRNGVGARSMALGGADVAYANDPLGAMAANPAGLGFLKESEVDLSLNGGFNYGDFSKPGTSGTLANTPGFSPDAAYAVHLGPVVAGLSFITESGASVDWRYSDPKVPGGVTYGYQNDKSLISLFRSALGLAYSPSPEWSFGFTGGLEYNQNHLETPYIFQKTHGLAGDKVLLDLTTDGIGWNGSVGGMYRPSDKLQFGVSYESPTVIYSQGTADGNAGTQLGVPSYPFHYDAQVKNVLPQTVTAGASWKPCDKWRVPVQVDWINWATAFNSLPVSLHNGTTALPATINDSIPLSWKNEFVYRAGLEYAATENWTLRGGYCFGESPIPDGTLTPMTAAIAEHTLTAGVGYNWNRYSIAFAYQWAIPATQHVGTSGLLAGEYSNSEVTVGMHIFSLTAGMKF